MENDPHYYHRLEVTFLMDLLVGGVSDMPASEGGPVCSNLKKTNKLVVFGKGDLVGFITAVKTGDII